MKAFLVILLLALVSTKNLRRLVLPDNQRSVKEEVEATVDILKMYGQGGFNKVLAYVNMVIDAIHSLVSTFSTRVTNTLERIRKGEGFKNFTGSIEYDFNIGFRAEGYSFFVDEIAYTVDIPDNYKGQFRQVLEEGEFQEEADLNDYELLYDKDKDAKDNYVSFVDVIIRQYRKGNKDKFDAIIMTAKANLKLFPHEFIWKKTKSIAGGISRSEENYSKYEERDITADDIKAIVNWFKLGTIKLLAETMGIKTKIQYP
jgi:hypothetical protein